MEDKGRGTNIVKLTVPGSPVSWQRPRAGRSPSGKPFFFEDKKVKGWKNFLKGEFAGTMVGKNMLGGDPKHPVPLTVEIRFYLKRPQKYYRAKDFDGPIPCTSRPDVDNLYKGVVDAMQGIVFRDDSLVSNIIVSKWYHAKNEGPRTDIQVEELEPRSG